MGTDRSRPRQKTKMIFTKGFELQNPIVYGNAVDYRVVCALFFFAIVGPDIFVANPKIYVFWGSAFFFLKKFGGSAF